MTKRAKNLIDQTYGMNRNDLPAIFALVEFAAQNSGIEWANYVTPGTHDREGAKAYREEARSITQDWQRFKSALTVAAIDGVTDADVIAEAPHAFSGRLEWMPTIKAGEGQWKATGWRYCTGQYFPTEYRKAAATLIEYATRRVRQARPAARQAVFSIAGLKALHQKNGGCWFNADTMRFFRSRIESEIIRNKYFITSEQNGDSGKRRFTLRSFDEEGDINTVGEFHSHDTKREAIAAIPREQEQAA